MSLRRSIRFRKARKRKHSESELPLTSMMDILVIILVFLLKSYSTSTHSLTTVPGIQIPISNSQEIPGESLQVIITPEGLTFENERIVDFVLTAAAAGSSESSYTFKKTDLDEENLRIIPLYDALIKAKDKADLLRAKSKARDENGQPLPFEGTLAIQADKRVRYETIRKIMYTAAAAGYKTFRFLAMSREG